MSTTFHEGERAVQAKAGMQAMADRVGPSIHDVMPAAAQEFLARQPMIFVGAAAADGCLWASALTGKPGFAHAVSSRRVKITTPLSIDDPLHTVWREGTEIGLLAIEFATRRRMRVNGSLVRDASEEFSVAVRQAYANCPKYIQARAWEGDFTTPQAERTSRRAEVLTEAQQLWIRNADTFFIASAHPESGADVSHRGGTPGFVDVTSGSALVFPDYAGNNMFNTLGNLAVNPRAGLLFVDFASGSSLQLTGEAQIKWGADLAAFAGAQRLIAFHVTGVVETAQAVPLRWRFLEASPFNPTA